MANDSPGNFKKGTLAKFVRKQRYFCSKKRGNKHRWKLWKVQIFQHPKNWKTLKLGRLWNTLFLTKFMVELFLTFLKQLNFPFVSFNRLLSFIEDSREPENPRRRGGGRRRLNVLSEWIFHSIKNPKLPSFFEALSNKKTKVSIIFNERQLFIKIHRGGKIFKQTLPVLKGLLCKLNVYKVNTLKKL